MIQPFLSDGDDLPAGFGKTDTDSPAIRGTDGTLQGSCTHHIFDRLRSGSGGERQGFRQFFQRNAFRTGERQGMDSFQNFLLASSQAEQKLSLLGRLGEKRIFPETIANFNDIKVGDLIELFEDQQVEVE